MENRAIKDTLSHFSTTFYKVIALHKQRNFDRLLYRQVLRKLFMDMQRNVSVIGEKRTKWRALGKNVPSILDEERTVQELLQATEGPVEWFEQFV